MSKFRNKTVIIEVVKWDGTNLVEVQAFLQGNPVSEDESKSSAWAKFEAMIRTKGLQIRGIDGEIFFADIGDYIIKDETGEFYPCKPDVFEKYYEKV